MDDLLRFGLFVSLGATAIGCGTAPGYYEAEAPVAQTTTTTTSTSGSTVIQAAPAAAVTPGAPTQPGQIVIHQSTGQTPVIIVPMPAPSQQRLAVQQVPAPPRVAAPAPAPNAAFVCSGNQTLRLINRHVNGEGGMAVYASGNCHVTIDEVIIRGTPAVVAVGNAQVELIESRIYGDLISRGNARVTTRGSRHHEGRVVTN